MNLFSSDTNAKAAVYNKGIGGQNSTEGRARFSADVIGLQPEYAFIYFGINDALNEAKFVDLDQYLENLAWMILQCRKNQITPVICTLHPIKEEPLFRRHPRDVYGSEGPDKKLERYNEGIVQLANAHSVQLADFATATRRKGIDKIVSEDGVHLTKEGNRLLAETFLAAARGSLRGDQSIVCIGDSITNGSGLPEAGTATGSTYPGLLAALIAGSGQ